jgi:hypothetical protein
VSWTEPFWQDYQPLLRSLAISGADCDGLPSAEQLGGLLPAGAVNDAGLPIRFVASQAPGQTPGAGNYETRISETGEVSTRADNWHDLFNALVWARLPRIKAKLNALHVQHMVGDNQGCVDQGSVNKGSRGATRDALTLFDESGVIVLSRDQSFLQALASRSGPEVFEQQDETWQHSCRVVVTGHALLEKFLHPYKSLTAHALLIQTSEDFFSQSEEAQLHSTDKELANQLATEQVLVSPACLSPLPLMGLPGWWPLGEQDVDFYRDRQVFRPAPATMKAPSLLTFSL